MLFPFFFFFLFFQPWESHCEAKAASWRAGNVGLTSKPGAHLNAIVALAVVRKGGKGAGTFPTHDTAVTKRPAKCLVDERGRKDGELARKGDHGDAGRGVKGGCDAGVCAVERGTQHA